MTDPSAQAASHPPPDVADVQAWAQWLNAQRQDVWRVVSYAMGDPATAEDLVQEVLAAAWMQRETLEPGRDPGPWLRSVARNLLRRELRRRSREARRLAVYEARQLERLETGRFDAHEGELRDALASCRAQLAEPTREALRLRYEEGLDFGAIAERQDRTLAGARQLLTRARGALRTCIERTLARDD